MSYDLYFPEQAVTAVGDDFGTMTALPGLKSTDKWTWVTSKQGEDYDRRNGQRLLMWMAIKYSM